MGCDCKDIPKGQICRDLCSVKAVVVVQVKTGGIPKKEEALAIIEELLASSFDETMDMTLMTEAAEQLTSLGYFDAALTMSTAVTSSLLYTDARFGNIADISEGLLKRSFELQANIMEAKGALEDAAEFRQEFIDSKSAAN